jgi:CRISPR/Cas system-associated exonuclease Cas4 (RecB family)
MCPKKWFFQYRTDDLPKKINYALLFGKEMHSFINYELLREVKGRNFFFKTLGSATRGWCRRWNNANKDPKKIESLFYQSQAMQKGYLQIGIGCVKNYWQANEFLPRPLEIEKYYRYLYPYSAGIDLIGVPDQVRSVSIEWIQKHRPELIADGRLDPKYAPAVIFDIKTGKESYDSSLNGYEELLKLNQAKSKLVRREEFEKAKKELVHLIGAQHKLHEDIQATMYTWLYEMKHGKKPIGFYWYNVRWGKGFFTYRNDSDYQTVFEMIKHMIDSINDESFPKAPSSNCSFCSFVEACRGCDKLIYSGVERSLPGQLEQDGEDKAPFLILANKKESEPKQLRLKFKIERVKKGQTK